MPKTRRTLLRHASLSRKLKLSKNAAGDINTVNPHADRNLSNQADRRQSDRFPIEREVRYRVLNKRSGEESGEGKTINISSSGVLFSSDHLLIPGRRWSSPLVGPPS